MRTSSIKKKIQRLHFLGIGAEKTIKGGTGSGDVNNRESVSIYAGMKENTHATGLTIVIQVTI